MLTSSTKDLSNDDLRQLVEQLIGEVSGLRERVRDLEQENAALKDEVARLKGHKGRPALKPSRMEKGTSKPKCQRGNEKGSRPSRQKLVVNEEHKLKITPPAGARFKGYEAFVVQELRLEPRIIRYRRQRWLTADGQTLMAPLPRGLRGHFGSELVRFILLQHHQGQVTVERITGLLNDFGLVISKRQVQRLLTGDVAAFAEEAHEVLRSGLETAPWITVDDTGARHRAKNGVTTQIGDDRFTFFATTFSKSRKNFLELLRAGHDDYVVNDDALDYMRGRNLAGPVIKQLGDHDDKIFANHATWSGHLERLGIDQLKVHPDPVKIATEGALFGSIRAHGFLQDTVILSDDAGQFRLGEHALCWVHAERLVHKLIGFNDQQRQALDVTRQLIWWFYRDLKTYKDDPCRKRATQMKVRFDRIFTRKTSFAPLDRLLTRLHGRKDELLLVLDRPEIPLHTNGSENDIRCHVTKRKVSGGTRSDDGRQARDTFLGLLKTCRKLGVSFFHYLGNRLGVDGAPDIMPLPDLVYAAKT